MAVVVMRRRTGAKTSRGTGDFPWLLFTTMEETLTPTKDQQKALNVLERYLNTKTGNPAVLAGYAGTGKTWTLKVLLQSLQGRTVVAAPTHKAVKNAARMLSQVVGIRIDFSTVQSLLKVNPTITDTGKRVFKSYAAGGSLPIEEYDNVIIDEASMLEDDLYTLIRHHVKRKACIIFIGDPAQLSPVSNPKNVKSIVFRKYKEEQLVMCPLREIVRQKEGSTIIDISMKYRSHNEPDQSEFYGDSSIISSEEVMPFLLSEFAEIKESGDIDSLRVLAYTNAKVNEINETVHQTLYGSELPICPGEVMVMQEPFIDKKNRLHTIQNAEELVVESVLRGSMRETVIVDPSWNEMLDEMTEDKVWSVDIETYVIKARDEKGVERTIEIAVNQQDWDSDLRILKMRIDRSRQVNKKELYKRYYRVKEKIADWKHGYAMTVHKSQGSTFERVVVMHSDIATSLKYGPAYWELMYTAVTRPSKQLLMCF